VPDMSLACESGLCRLSLAAAWLKDNPLTRAALEAELREWGKAAAGLRLELGAL